MINEKDILEYKNFKKKKIEDINYLSLDNLLVTRESLQDFFFENDAIILTIRNNKKNLFKQLNILNIDFLRDKIISLNNDGIYTKASWVRKNINRNEKKIVVGDSEIDLKIGEIYNTVVYIVETGLRNPYKILKMNNIQGYIVPHINSCLNVKQNKFEI